jgi:type IV secretion system protein VirB10
MSLFRSLRPAESADPGSQTGDRDPGAPPDPRETQNPGVQSVAGERGISSINRARSLQSRITNLLAMGLMCALGVGLLGWYYAHTFAAQSRARQNAHTAARSKAQGDMPLPSLGQIDPPAPAPAAGSAVSPSVVASVLGPPPEVPATGVPSGLSQPGPPQPVGSGAPPMKSPQELALERKLSGPAFDSQPDSASSASGGQSAEAAQAVELPAATVSPEPPPATHGTAAAGAPTGGLQGLLTPTVTPAVRPTVLPTQRLLLPKGAFIDCTLETAVDSTLPGMTTCITATDTFSADGSTVLMERGTKLVGETRGEVQQGSARVFVLWSEARTPTGVVIPLDSPGTDELGRSGLSGTVNRHFWQRFGAAILISVINGGVQYAVQSQNKGGAVIYDPGATQEVMTDALKGTVNIPPTVTVANGSRIQVLVARDLDFRSVYELRPTSGAR